MNIDQAGSILLYIFLPAIGLGLLVFSVIVLLRPRMRTLLDHQKLSGFGIELDVSLLTMFVIIGAGFLSLGVYANLTRLADRVKELTAKLDKLDQSQTIDMPARITLTGVTWENAPKLDVLQCNLLHTGSQPSESLQPSRKPKPDEVGVLIPNVKRDVRVTIECVDPDSKRHWLVENAAAFELSLAAGLLK